MSTKIHALVDALGNPVAFSLSGRQAHDLAGADDLLPGMQADSLRLDRMLPEMRCAWMIFALK